MTTNPGTNPVLDAALAYAAAGIPVFAVWGVTDGQCDCGTPDCPNAGKHPHRLAPSGHLSATTDADRVTEIWSIAPTPNVGINLEAAGLLVIGPDSPEWLARFEAQGLPPTVVVQSGGGEGHKHFYFRRPEDCPITRLCRSGEYDVISNGYAVAPPSKHKSGGTYQLLTGLDTPIPEAPGWAVQMLKDKEAARTDFEPLDPDEPPVPLTGTALQRWNGQLLEYKPNGDVDRSGTLIKIAEVLVQAGLARRWTVEALENRDLRIIGPLTTGPKYAGRPEAEKRYIEVFEKALSRVKPAPAMGPKPMNRKEMYDLLINTERSDAGLAERFARLCGDEAVYCFDTGAWYVWNGEYHEKDETERVLQLMVRVARKVKLAASWMPTTTPAEQKEAKDMFGWALRAENAPRLKSAVDLARGLVHRRFEELDADPHLFCCKNGVVNLRTGELLPHSVDRIMTCQSPVSYDPNAQSDLLDNFLASFTNSDRALQSYLQEQTGVSLTGEVIDQNIVLLIGTGGSGKSTFSQMLLAVFGSYGRTAAARTFIEKTQVSGGPEPEVLNMASARLVIGVESGAGQRLAMALLKRLSGGDTVTARGMYISKEPQFQPKMTIWMTMNQTPKIDKDDTGAWRRVVKITANQAIPEESQDSSVKQRLQNPEDCGPAVLAWAVEGAVRWYAAGMKLVKPEAVRAATDEFRAQQDPVGEFVKQECRADADERLGVSAFKEAFRAWCRERQIIPPRPHAIDEQMEDLGFPKEKHVRLWAFVGLTLKSATSAADRGEQPAPINPITFMRDSA